MTATYFPLLRDAILKDKPEKTHIVLDLSAVTYVDSTGLHALHNWHKELQAVGKRLTLTQVPEFLKDLIQTVHFKLILQ